MQETSTTQKPIQTLHRPTYVPPKYPMPQPPQMPRGSRKRFWLFMGIIAIGLAVGIGGSSIIWSLIKQPVTLPATQPTQQVTAQPAPTLAPTEAPQPTVTVAPQPTLSPAQLEKKFKSMTLDTTVAALDKEGNSYKEKYVHFTCTLSSFVRDSNGYTVGANVSDPKSYDVIQVVFRDGTDLEKLNKGDTLEVWGVDGGIYSGKNAFGVTVQEVVIGAMYITDQTSGYATH